MVQMACFLREFRHEHLFFGASCILSWQDYRIHLFHVKSRIYGDNLTRIILFVRFTQSFGRVDEGCWLLALVGGIGRFSPGPMYRHSLRELCI